jgi:recombinational DNA repair protein (RecF pathway)
MIMASAQGIRKISSKLRFVLQDYSYIKVDLVKGKELWRVTSASKTGQLEGISKNTDKLFIFSNLSRLLKRLLAGEESNEILFIDLIDGLKILEISKIDEELRNIEAVIVLRILSNLGYIGDDQALENIIKSPFDMDIMFEVSKIRTKILSEINKALKETHL